MWVLGILRKESVVCCGRAGRQHKSILACEVSTVCVGCRVQAIAMETRRLLVAEVVVATKSGRDCCQDGMSICGFTLEAERTGSRNVGIAVLQTCDRLTEAVVMCEVEYQEIGNGRPRSAQEAAATKKRRETEIRERKSEGVAETGMQEASRRRRRWRWLDDAMSMDSGQGRV